VPISTFGAPEDRDTLRRYRDLGVSRVVVTLDSEKAETILPVLDRWAALIRQV
jgi:MoaA/NifB/PqqE/SkfB family radical SAM enzyme